MPAKAGKNVILKIRTVESPETFATVGGARMHNVKKNDGVVDTSDKDSAGWTDSEYLGLQSLEISQAGLYKGTVGEKFLMTHIETDAGSKSPVRMQLIEPGRGTYEFNATVEREMSAPHDNAKEQTFTFRNAGAVTFTADSPQS